MSSFYDDVKPEFIMWQAFTGVPSLEQYLGYAPDDKDIMFLCQGLHYHYYYVRAPQDPCGVVILKGKFKEDPVMHIWWRSGKGDERLVLELPRGIKTTEAEHKKLKWMREEVDICSTVQMFNSAGPELCYLWFPAVSFARGLLSCCKESFLRSKHGFMAETDPMFAGEDLMQNPLFREVRRMDPALPAADLPIHKIDPVPPAADLPIHKIDAAPPAADLPIRESIFTANFAAFQKKVVADNIDVTKEHIPGFDLEGDELKTETAKCSIVEAVYQIIFGEGASAGIYEIMQYCLSQGADPTDTVGMYGLKEIAYGVCAMVERGKDGVSVLAKALVLQLAKHPKVNKEEVFTPLLLEAAKSNQNMLFATLVAAGIQLDLSVTVGIVEAGNTEAIRSILPTLETAMKLRPMGEWKPQVFPQVRFFVTGLEKFSDEDFGEMSLVHVACACGTNESLLTYLFVELGVPLDFKTSTGLTPLHVIMASARLSYLVEFLRIVSEKHASIRDLGNMRDTTYGLSPLDIACCRSIVDNINLKDMNSYYGLNVEDRYKAESFITEGRFVNRKTGFGGKVTYAFDTLLEMVRVLLEAGVDINSKWTPPLDVTPPDLGSSFPRGYFFFPDDNETTPASKDTEEDGITALHYAAGANYSYRTDVNSMCMVQRNPRDYRQRKLKDGWGPQYQSRCNHSAGLVKLLLTKGAKESVNVSIPKRLVGASGITPFVLFCSWTNLESDANTMSGAFPEHYEPLVDLFLEAFDGKSKSDAQWTPLGLAVLLRNPVLVPKILEKAPDLHMNMNQPSYNLCFYAGTDMAYKLKNVYNCKNPSESMHMDLLTLNADPREESCNDEYFYECPLHHEKTNYRKWSEMDALLEGAGVVKADPQVRVDFLKAREEAWADKAEQIRRNEER